MVRRQQQVLHELPADRSDLLGEGRAEHHHLLLHGRHPEDLLHVTPHIWGKRGEGLLFERDTFSKWNVLTLDDNNK